MEINLFSKCIKELIVENDRVDVPYLGTFTAEMMPASYSDRQTTIHPPYRRMSFRKADVTLADGGLLLDKVRREISVTHDQAGVELGWCLSRLCSELEGRKSCKLPGLGVMRANARNEFFFVPDEDLDIWPDGIGFEAIAIKMPREARWAEEMPGQAGHDAEGQAGHDAEEPAVQEERLTTVVASKPKEPTKKRSRRHLKPVWIGLIVLGALLLLFIAACYLFTDQMSPILDPLLYTKEELELLRGQ
ncbi:MAG: hypothetical protein J5382_09690 [Bacteroidales bacterium]|nr:hypothetical protein [Bacteroidales bacterium]